MLLFVCAVLVSNISIALSGIVTTPGMQRKSPGETVTFQWSVTGSISNYSVYNLNQGTLNTNSNYTLDRQNGVVTLIIRNIQLPDAGNYSLSVTIGTTTQTDAGALLFVYGSLIIFVNQTSVGNTPPQPATEGDTVELTCTVTSSSLPVAYRPKMYYQWYLIGIGTLQNVSSGPAKLVYSDDPIFGYSIKNDGRTIVIASAQYLDTQGIICYGQEQWSPYRTSSNWYYLPLKYRPYINSRTPGSKKFNAVRGDTVSLSFYFEAVPDVTSSTNWSFVDTAGQVQELPAGTTYRQYSSSYSLVFTFSSEAYYGYYSVGLSNAIGSTTETFQVLRPRPPDAPSSVRAAFVAHYLIVIAWNCMWFNGRQQTIFLQLKATYNDSVIDSWNTSVSSSCYNATYTTQFQNGIQPETNYEVRIWSINDLGSSDETALTVKTPKLFKFFVSPKNISFNGNQAVVNFSATGNKIARLGVTYCIELTGYCSTNYYYFNVNSTGGQITLDKLQPGDVYLFDFAVYGGDPNRNIYFLTMVKGLRVSRNGDAPEIPETPVVNEANPLLIPVIVLAVLLGVAVLALIGGLIAFLVSKRRQNTQPSNSRQSQQSRATPNNRAWEITAQQNNQAYVDEDTYETVEEGNPSRNDAHYTALEGPRGS